jgi:Protein of unknown function (DUF3040)
MLNEHDRRELASIEERLRADDRVFAETFPTGPSRPRRGRRLAIRALLCLGAFMLTVGLVAGAGGVFLQGLLVFGAGIVWTLWLRRTAADEGHSAPTAHPGDRSPSEGPPPEWYRPI